MRSPVAPVRWGIGALTYVAGLIAVGPLVAETPLTALAQVIIDSSPVIVSQTAIDLFGKAAQPLLVAGVAGAMILAAVGLSRAWARLPADGRQPLVGLGALAMASMVGFLLSAGVSVAAVLAGLLAVVPVALLRWAFAASGSGANRRTFLRRAGIAGLALAGAGGGALGVDRVTRDGVQPGESLADQRRTEKATTGRTLTAATDTPTPAAAADSGNDLGMESADRQPVTVSTIDSDADFDFDFRGMPARITAVEDHYVVDKQVSDPEIDADAWTLNVGGRAAESTYDLTLEDLVGHPASREQVVTMVCVSNPVGGPLVSTSRWRGVPLRALLEEAGVAADALDIVSQAEDGYTESIPWEIVRNRPDIMLAYGINGSTLPRANGFPARLLIPGRYGMKSTKWVVGVGAVPTQYQGYWEDRGWEEEAVVNTLSYIRAAQRRGDRVALGGIAFAGRRGIDRVEVSLDGGETWNGATLEDPLSRTARRRWRYVTDSAPESFEAVVRATDGTGTVQTNVQSEPYPAGSTGWHRVELEV